MCPNLIIVLHGWGHRRIRGNLYAKTATGSQQAFQDYYLSDNSLIVKS
jgi:hypothetical protein